MQAHEWLFTCLKNHHSALMSFHIIILHTFARSTLGGTQPAARSHRICFCSPTSQPTNERTYIAFVFWPRISERSLASNITVPHVDRPNPSRDTRSHSRASQSIYRGREQDKQKYHTASISADARLNHQPPTTTILPTLHHSTVRRLQIVIETTSTSYSKPIKSRLVSALLGSVEAVLVVTRAMRLFITKFQSIYLFYDMPRAQRGRAQHPAGVARVCTRNISYLGIILTCRRLSA